MFVILVVPYSSSGSPAVCLASKLSLRCKKPSRFLNLVRREFPTAGAYNQVCPSSASCERGHPSNPPRLEGPTGAWR
jgi:hypothetical protein